jgi:sirohydrochlorin ferrochelatase
METSQVVQELCDVLTARLVAALAGAKDADHVGKWATGSLEPTQSAGKRLRFAHEVLREIAGAHETRAAQAWTLTVNPRLGYDSPLKAIREDRFQEAAAAAKALLEDAYDG